MSSTSNSISAVADASESGIRASRIAASKTLDRFADGAVEFRDRMAPVIDRWADRSTDTARIAAARLRDGIEFGRTQATRATEISGRAVGYARQEPVRAALVVVAAGAVIYALSRLVRRYTTQD